MNGYPQFSDMTAAIIPKTKAMELATWAAPLFGALVSTLVSEAVGVDREVRLDRSEVDVRDCVLKVVLRETGELVPEEALEVMVEFEVSVAEAVVPEKEMLDDPEPPTNAKGPE